MATKLYSGTAEEGRLFEWNNVDAWAEKAPQLNSQTLVLSLAVFNNKLYGGTGSGGRLFEWNGTDAWVQKAPQLNSQTHIHSLAVFEAGNGNVTTRVPEADRVTLANAVILSPANVYQNQRPRQFFEVA